MLVTQRERRACMLAFIKALSVTFSFHVPCGPRREIVLAFIRELLRIEFIPFPSKSDFHTYFQSTNKQTRTSSFNKRQAFVGPDSASSDQIQTDVCLFPVEGIKPHWEFAKLGQQTSDNKASPMEFAIP